MEAARPASTLRRTGPDHEPRGLEPFVLVCDHASNFLPASSARSASNTADLTRHIAWDPGALPVARRMAEALDAVLVESCISRLVIDCNRPLDAPDLIPPVSETTDHSGQRRPSGPASATRASRCRGSRSTTPSKRSSRSGWRAGRDDRLVSVHSFTPVYKA